ncbi:MAG: hypothetical protein LBS44_04635, partial [Deltaproteobacteria bacterium]|nr:hypothetical protein [Deltaproteobacteria bacterium]
LRVKTQNGEEIPVNKKTLADLEDTSFLLEGKATLIKNKIATLDKKIEPLKRKQEEQETILFALNTNMNKINSEIPRFSIDVFATKRIILKLEKERKDLNESHLQSLKPNKLLIAEFHAEFQQLITTYATRLDLDKKYYTEKNDFIFTHDHKSLSGAILNTLVFVFKISSVRMVQNHTGVCLPIILDSPYGGEIRPEIVKKMMAILSDDFSDHQVIIASLHKNKDFPNPNVIELTDRLLPF